MPPHSGHCTDTRWWTDCAREHAYSTVLAGRAAPVDDADADEEAGFEEAAAFERRASLERLVRRRSARLRLKAPSSAEIFTISAGSSVEEADAADDDLPAAEPPMEGNAEAVAAAAAGVARDTDWV